MRSLVGKIVLVLGLLIGSGAPAHALNFCFNPGLTDPGYASLAVAQRFHKPAKGACSSITGFDIGRGDYRGVSGTACLNSASDTLHVSYLILTSQIYIAQHVQMDLAYPSLSSGYGYVSKDGSDTSGSSTSTGAHANACIPQAIAIP